MCVCDKVPRPTEPWGPQVSGLSCFRLSAGEWFRLFTMQRDDVT